MDPIEAQRAIATLHSFRFFGLVFILPGVVSPLRPARFAEFAAYGDFATGLLAILALLTARRGPLSWLFVVAFNLGRHLRDSDHLRSHADDYACCRLLSAAAPSAQGDVDQPRTDLNFVTSGASSASPYRLSRAL